MCQFPITTHNIWCPDRFIYTRGKVDSGTAGCTLVSWAPSCWRPRSTAVCWLTGSPVMNRRERQWPWLWSDMCSCCWRRSWDESVQTFNNCDISLQFHGEKPQIMDSVSMKRGHGVYSQQPLLGLLRSCCWVWATEWTGATRAAEDTGATSLHAEGTHWDHLLSEIQSWLSVNEYGKKDVSICFWCLQAATV